MSKVLNVKLDADEEKVNQLTETETNKFGLFSKEFVKRHGLHLVGTISTWFLLDISFYSQNLFQKDIFTVIGWIPQPEEMNAIQEVYNIARVQTLVALCSTIPGYWFTVVFIDHIGRLMIQLMGFFFMAVFMFALAIPYHHWTSHRSGLITMYYLTFFFSNFGPNVTTFIVPAEIFPARLRSTCHGISAAGGKAGAIVGVVIYSTKVEIKKLLFMLGVINLFGMLFTLLVPESKGKSLEELSGENDDEV